MEKRGWQGSQLHWHWGWTPRFHSFAAKVQKFVVQVSLIFPSPGYEKVQRCRLPWWREESPPQTGFLNASLCWGHFKQIQLWFAMLFWDALNVSHPFKNISPFWVIEQATFFFFFWAFNFFCTIWPGLFFFFSAARLLSVASCPHLFKGQAQAVPVPEGMTCLFFF